MIAIKDLVNERLRGKTLFAYSGKFDKSVTDDLIAQLDDMLSSSLLSTKVRKKIFNISIEVLQNLYHYLGDKSDDGQMNEGAFAMAEYEKGVEIISGNYLNKDEVNSLKARINMVNNLKDENLTNLYRGVLEIGDISSKGGAGLGFIDIKKKSGNPLDYTFTPVNDEYALYTLKITI